MLSSFSLWIFKHERLSKVSKKKQQWDTYAGEDGAAGNTDTLAALPTSDNPASEHSLKNMLLSLKRDLQREIHKAVMQIQSQVDHIGERTSELEQQMS